MTLFTRALTLGTFTAALAAPSIAQDVEGVPGPEAPAETQDERIDPIGGEILGRPVKGEVLPEKAFGATVIESMDVVLQRMADREEDRTNTRLRNGRQGEWRVPSVKMRRYPVSGEKLVYNHWGDSSMGIRFDSVVEPVDVMVTVQGGGGAWAEGVRVVGYLDGAEVGATEWLRDLSPRAQRLSLDLGRVDRIVFEGDPTPEGIAFFAIDDLSFQRGETDVVLDFEDLGWEAKLTDYAGLEWETGTGDFKIEESDVEIVPGPRAPEEATTGTTFGTTLSVAGGGGTLPALVQEFQGPRIGDAGANLIPPDTCGAAGTDFFVSVVNANLSVYEKDTGNRTLSVNLDDFFNVGFCGDPRVAYDFADDRWVVIATSFDDFTYVAYSLTSDPNGAWFKAQVDFAQGSDSNRWVDYPTLGVDSRGIFIAAFMVGSPAQMSIFTIDKAPLLQSTPTLGTVTAFREFPFEGAIHHATQYTDAGASYLVSERSSNTLRLRRIDPPMTAPTLTTFTVSGIPQYSSPPNAPALGSTTDISTVGSRIMNASFAAGSLWCAHCVDANGLAASRWYEIDVATNSLIQSGTVTDVSLNYYYPTIAADAQGNVVMGFSGSDANQFVGCYYTGRTAADPPGQMGVPVQYSPGLAPYTIVDGAGRNRWGDYSLTSLDPADGTFWTIQERAGEGGNTWWTRIAQVEHETCGTPERYCTPNANSTGVAAQVSFVGSTDLSANNLRFIAAPVPPSSFGLFYYGTSQVSVASGDGIVCVGNFFRQPVVTSNILGFADYAFDLNTLPPGGAISPGETWNFSYWFRDSTPGGFNFSDALSITFCD
ncbi:MAG: hypothetical protein AAGA20_02090 [Planctomycetota bacterium]